MIPSKRDSVIKSQPKKKSSQIDSVQSSTNVQRRIDASIPEIMPQNRNRIDIPNSFYESTITLTHKPHKDIRKKIAC